MSKVSNVNRKKIKKNNRFGKKFVIVGSITCVIVTGVSINCYNHSLKKFEKDLVKNGVIISTAEYGTMDFEKDDKISFSIANCGNSSTGLSENATSILSNTEIPTGIIVNPQCKELYDLYKEVDYTKDIVSKYNVEYPVFLNVNGMFNVMMNDNAHINDMVNAYVKKLQDNGCYVIVIGDKIFMDILKKQKKVTDELLEESEVEYPVGVIVEKVENVNDELYSIIIGKDYIYARENLKLIINGKYNMDSLFVDPYEYIVESGDNLTSIGEEFGINEQDIRMYNSIGTVIYPGDVLDIPNKYQPPYYRGIDISSNQGNINWTATGSNIDYAILRVGYTSKEEVAEITSIVDPYFHYNISECNKKRIPVGIYYTTSSMSKYQIDEEVNVLLKQLANHDVSLPIYINILENIDLEIEDNRRAAVDLADYFCSKIREAGYTPGIYVHQNVIAYIPELVKKYTLWGYGGLRYNDNQGYNDLNYDYRLSDQVPIFQSTKTGTASDVNVYESLFVGYDYADRNFINSLLENKEAKVKRYRNK